MKRIFDDLYNLVQKIEMKPYSKAELMKLVLEYLHISYMSDNSIKTYFSQIVSKIFTFEHKIYTPKKNVFKLIQNTYTNRNVICKYLFGMDAKIDYRGVHGDKEAILKFVIAEYVKVYSYYSTDAFVSIIQSVVNMGFSESDIYDYLEREDKKSLEWQRRCGLNQIIVYS